MRHGGLKPSLQPCVLFCGQTSPQVALVQWNCCIMWAKLRIRIYVIQLCIKTCKMQRFHWTRATRGDVWPRKSTHGCKPGFRPPLCPPWRRVKMLCLFILSLATGGAETRFSIKRFYLQQFLVIRGQTSPRVALVQWNRCILQVFMHNRITYIRTVVPL